MSAGWKKNVSSGKLLGQLAAKIGHVRCCWCVLFVERDQDFAVHRTDRRRVAQRDVNAAVRQTDVVQDDVDLVITDEPPDRAFDPGEFLLRRFEPCARRAANVQPHLAGIYLWEEILAQAGEEQARNNHQDDEENDGRKRLAHAPINRRAICIAKPVESIIEPAMNQPEWVAGFAMRIAGIVIQMHLAHVPAQQIIEQHRNQGE